jgi:hypothetical protein
MYIVVSRLPVAKKVWQFNMVAKNINLDDAIEITLNKIEEVIEKMIEWRMKHPRAFKAMPLYLKFFVNRTGNPQVVRSKNLGEFNIWLDDGRVEIVKNWM